MKRKRSPESAVFDRDRTIAINAFMSGDLAAWEDACTRLRATVRQRMKGHMSLTEAEVEAFILLRRIVKRGQPPLHSLIAKMADRLKGDKELAAAAREYARDLKAVAMFLDEEGQQRWRSASCSATSPTRTPATGTTSTSRSTSATSPRR